MTFNDRFDAGAQLARALSPYREKNVIVFALTRGGVPVGYEVARFLKAPLDVLVIRKLGAPDQPELALGAAGPGSVVVLNRELIRQLGVSDSQLEPIIRHAREEQERRQRKIRNDQPIPMICGKTAIIVDDGLATGASALAAIQAVRKMEADRIVLAVPVCARDSVAALRREVDDLICLDSPVHFQSVSLWYRDFSQTTDDEVSELLHKSWKETPNVPISSY